MSEPDYRRRPRLLKYPSEARLAELLEHNALIARSLPTVDASFKAKLAFLRQARTWGDSSIVAQCEAYRSWSSRRRSIRFRIDGLPLRARYVSVMSHYRRHESRSGQIRGLRSRRRPFLFSIFRCDAAGEVSKAILFGIGYADKSDRCSRNPKSAAEQHGPRPAIDAATG